MLYGMYMYVRRQEQRWKLHVCHMTLYYVGNANFGWSHCPHQSISSIQMSHQVKPEVKGYRERQYPLSMLGRTSTAAFKYGQTMTDSLLVMLAVVEYCSSCCVHFLDDQVVKDHLLLGSLDNVLLHTSLRHKAIDVYLCDVDVNYIVKYGYH